MDEKKANLYWAGLTIHLQERLVQFTSLSYNELVSAAIDQERGRWKPLLRPMRRRGIGRCLDPLAVVVLVVLLPSTACVYPT
jgi:hypothetical protein